MHRTALATFAAIGLTGCAGATGNNTTASPKQRTDTKAAHQTRHHKRFEGVDADNYETAKQTCGTFGLGTAARQLHTSRDPVAVATALSMKYRPGFRQPVFEGCLAALLAALK